MLQSAPLSVMCYIADMNQETQKDALTLVAFIIQKSKTEGDNTAVENFKQAVAEFDFSKPVTQNEAVGSTFDILRDVAKMTPSDADDKAVATAELIFRSLKPVEGDSNGGGLLENIKNIFRRRRNR